MSEEKTARTWADIIGSVATPENIQKYVLGVKKSGAPRAIYDVIKDYTKPKKKKGKKNRKNAYSLYLKTKKGKKKKKHWKF